MTPVPGLYSPENTANLAWKAHVFPENYQNPTPARRYNLVVLGAGPAGLICAAAAAGLGAKVALIEKTAMGGDCLNVGCVPSKTYISASKSLQVAMDASEQSKDHAFASVMARVRETRSHLSHHDSVARFTELGVDVFLGAGRFLQPGTIQVGDQKLNYRKAVIATGTHAAMPAIPGLIPEKTLTNFSFFSLTERPKHLAIIGGGPIGCEIAQATAHLGIPVTLIVRGERILPRDDPDAARIVQDALLRSGVHILLQKEVTSIQHLENESLLHIDGDPAPQIVPASHVLVATGRVPNVTGLGLEQVGVEYDASTGIVVNERLRTTNKHIFAAGDVCSPYRFTHTADMMARTVVRNALFRGRARFLHHQIPWCTYTDPELAQIGLTQEVATSQQIKTDLYEVPFAALDRAQTDGKTTGFIRIVAQANKDRILGATIVGHGAGEIAGAISIAMQAKIGLKQFAATMLPYPTYMEVLRKVGDQFNRTRFTPLVAKLFRWWLRWNR